jgi:HSP20 family protein
MAIVRWDPFRELVDMQRSVDQLMRGFSPQGGREEAVGTNFVPPVDVYEDNNGLTLKMEVPGIDEKDIDVRLENNVLTVHGERKIEKEEKEENFQRVERRYGSFTRSFTLPNTVDTESVSADYDKGVLKIHLNKRAEAKPKQIKVNVGGGQTQKTIEGGKGNTSKVVNFKLRPNPLAD